MANEHVHAEEASHICTTLFTDLTHLSELKTASALTQASEIKPTTLSGKTQIHAIGSVQQHKISTRCVP
jgi:uncharacterized pyridoxal phosphate-containing UPF0001 family protein